MEMGDYEAAALAFQTLAHKAVQMNLPSAPQLLLQAARALLAGGGEAGARPLLLQAFQIMAERRDSRLGILGRRVLEELRGTDHADLAAAVQAELDALPGGLPATANTTTPASRARLPAKCPWCGGSVHTDEVDWAETDRPECAYCGSPLLGEANADG
jgi:hypothetical protein